MLMANWRINKHYFQIEEIINLYMRNSIPVQRIKFTENQLPKDGRN